MIIIVNVDIMLIDMILMLMIDIDNDDYWSISNLDRY
jgi:hypothetical protein